jgi:putative transposase
VVKIVEDEEALLCYYDYPAEHWQPLRTTNLIESPFASVKARTDLTKGPGSREAGMAMILRFWKQPRGSGAG